MRSSQLKWSYAERPSSSRRSSALVHLQRSLGRHRLRRGVERRIGAREIAGGVEREAEELRAPDAVGGASARHVDRGGGLSLIDEEAHTLAGDPGVVRMALGEGGSESMSTARACAHAVARRRARVATSRSTRSSALRGLAGGYQFGHIERRLARWITLGGFMNAADPIDVAAVPMAVDIAQTNVVVAVASAGTLKPRGAPGREESEHGVAGGIGGRARRAWGAGESRLRCWSSLQKQGDERSV